MEEKRLTLDVVTLKKVVLSETIESVVAPGTIGYFSILTGHTPFVSTLQTGVTKITKTNGERLSLATSGGFFMTDGKKVILLVETAERPDEIDANRAQAARVRAEKRLIERSPNIDIARAKAALLRAITRLKIAAH